jgi:hypothetical protein
MKGTFLGHLEDLVEQTSGISERVNEFGEVLEHQNPLIWDKRINSGFGMSETNLSTLLLRKLNDTLSFLRKYVKIELAISPNGKEYFWNFSRDTLLDRF